VAEAVRGAERIHLSLVSGDPARHEALQPALKRMTGSLKWTRPATRT
jgi:hypothetical protein